MSVVEAGAIDAVCRVLSVNDTKMLLVALDAIDQILKTGVAQNCDFLSFVDECDGITAIEGLQEHESDDVYQKAIHIIETYFGADDGAEDENLALRVTATRSHLVSRILTMPTLLLPALTPSHLARPHLTLLPSK